MNQARQIVFSVILALICIGLCLFADMRFQLEATVTMMFIAPLLYLVLLYFKRAGMQYYVFSPAVHVLVCAALLLVLWLAAANWVPVPTARGYRIGLSQKAVSIRYGEWSHAWLGCFFKIFLTEILAYFVFEIIALKKLAAISAFLTKDCDPQRYLAGVSPILARIRRTKRSPRSANPAVTMCNAAAALQESGDGEQAAALLREMLDTPLLQNHKYAYIRTNIFARLSSIYKQEGNSERALAAMTDAVRAADNYRGKNKRVIAYLEEEKSAIFASRALMMNDPQTALPVVQKLESQAKTPFSHLQLHCRLAETYHALGDETLARHHLELAEQIKPDLATVQFTRAVLSA